MSSPVVKTFFDEPSHTYCHVVIDPETKHCAIIDPVLDWDEKAGRSSTETADKLLDYIKAEGLTVDWLLETHVHADHITSAAYLKKKLPNAKTAIGDHIKEVQKTFSGIFNAESGFRADGSQFDRLLADGDEIDIGNLKLNVMHTPGHTPNCMTYVVGDCAFVGDLIFMPDVGTGRCDFPGGDAEKLFDSVQKLYTLPDDTKLYLCHDYSENGRALSYMTTVGDEKANNVHVSTKANKADFAKGRRSRDAKMAMPRLILHAVQINMRGGEFPPAEDNGVSYLKIPVNAL